MQTDLQRTVTLCAPGRLHLGFFDPAGSLGRRFGSLGLVLDGFETEVEFSVSTRDEIIASGPAAQAEVERAVAHLRRLRQCSGRPEPLRLRLARVLPPHAGFGSGTQLALALGRAFAQWHHLVVSTATLAQWLGRGARSGIGISGFDHGGLLVDGGPGADGTPAPLLARVPLPEAWRVVVVQDSASRGLSGAGESHVMDRLAPLSREAAADICHQVLMRVLPGAACAEFSAFATGINRIQRLLGDYFAPGQNNSAYTSPAVGRLMEWTALAAFEHEAALGQSSWGPTGFAIVASQAGAEALVNAAQSAGQVDPGLTLRIVAGRNVGATVIDMKAR